MVIRGSIIVGVTHDHVVAGEIRIDSGLVQLQSNRVRPNRVQSVDELEPLAARSFGLAEVKVTTAGTERAGVRRGYPALPVTVTAMSPARPT